MTEQPLDLKRSMHIVRRHWILVCLIALLGGLAGAAYTVYKPPLLSSSALVEVSAPASGTLTQVVIAGADEKVLAGGLRGAAPGTSVLTLRKLIKVSSPAPGVLSITAEGKTAALAERTANAVANSYIAYVNSSTSASGTSASSTRTPGSGAGGLNLRASMFAAATIATGPSLVTSLLTSGGIGALVAGMIGAVAALALSRRDRRLRLRNEIADAIGVPVLASISGHHPGSVAHWSGLLDNYQPSAADAWRLRGALHHLGLADVAAIRMGAGRSVTVISISSDKRALAIGPQLAAYASTLGLPTMLVIGPQQDAGPTAKLRTACAAMARSLRRRGGLRVVVADSDQPAQLPGAMLKVVIAVVDGRAPQFETAIGTDLAVLGVSAGATTADELALVAAGAGAAGLEIAGILVADPDETDPTTGRIPHMGRNARQMRPTRLTGTTTETGL